MTLGAPRLESVPLRGPASNITDPLPRPILRAAGMSGAVLAEGEVCLLNGAGGAAKSTLATTLALDVGYGGELADPYKADGMGRGFSGLFEVRAGTRDDGQLRGPRRKS